MVKGFLAVCLLPAAVWTQETPESAGGTVSGAVKDVLTHVPLADVPVMSGGSRVTTDAAGRFLIEHLDAGRQWISVYDQRRGLSAGAYVLVSAGQEAQVEIFVQMGGSISGKVIGEDLKPVAGASVLLLERKFESGQAVYGWELTATTGDDGAYRLEPVQAGRGYLILAKKPLTLAAQKEGAAPESGERERVALPAYYPNALDAMGAQPVLLSPGENRSGADIRMAAAEGYCIHGALKAPGGGAPDSLEVTEHMALLERSAFAAAAIPVRAGGEFHACGLHPGDYLLSASTGQTSNPPPSDSVSALAEITITDRDLRELELLARPPAVLSGSAAWDPAPPGKAAVNLVRIDLTKVLILDEADKATGPSGMGFGFGYGGRFMVPGPFELGRVPAAGDYQLNVKGLPSGCYLKVARYGSTSILDGRLRIGATAEGAIGLVLACDGGFVSARVSDSDGNPVSHVHVYVMPAGAASAAALSNTLQSGEVERGWSEAAGPLPPGKYLVLASDLEMDGTAAPVERLWAARQRAKEVDVGPNATVQVTLEAARID